MIDCIHESVFVNVPGIPAGEGGACGRCGMVVTGTYADLLRFAAQAMDYASDIENTISSIEQSYPMTAAKRMERRLKLRKQFIAAAQYLRQKESDA